MKCPACGFETPEAQGYCDFCKEPFRRKKGEEAPVQDAAPAAVPVPPAPLPVPDAKPAPAEAPAWLSEPGIPPQFKHLDAGERIPEISPPIRMAAWCFLAAVVVWFAVLGFVGVSKAREKARHDPGSEIPAPVAPNPVPPEPSPTSQ